MGSAEPDDGKHITLSDALPTLHLLWLILGGQCRARRWSAHHSVCCTAHPTSIVVNPWWAVPSQTMVSTSLCLMHCPPYIYCG
ncbi:hypothetical protein [Moorena producens]|uniref:hypothetical protein n=1 Tax=Moorena producens TaxID=1155739 RepID=UPI0011EA6C38|nr:hypothetical protein [Moorena producens]